VATPFIFRHFPMPYSRLSRRRSRSARPDAIVSNAWISPMTTNCMDRRVPHESIARPSQHKDTLSGVRESSVERRKPKINYSAIPASPRSILRAVVTRCELVRLTRERRTGNHRIVVKALSTTTIRPGHARDPRCTPVDKPCIRRVIQEAGFRFFHNRAEQRRRLRRTLCRVEQQRCVAYLYDA
jgi:hypothetical protein